MSGLDTTAVMKVLQFLRRNRNGLNALGLSVAIGAGDINRQKISKLANSVAFNATTLGKLSSELRNAIASLTGALSNDSELLNRAAKGSFQPIYDASRDGSMPLIVRSFANQLWREIEPIVARAKSLIPRPLSPGVKAPPKKQVAERKIVKKVPRYDASGRQIGWREQIITVKSGAPTPAPAPIPAPAPKRMAPPPALKAVTKTEQLLTEAKKILEAENRIAIPVSEHIKLVADKVGATAKEFETVLDTLGLRNLANQSLSQAPPPEVTGQSSDVWKVAAIAGGGILLLKLFS